jgi:anthranilate synthase/aminodeoxychorismate synthase-like glutamine amidotransferase
MIDNYDSFTFNLVHLLAGLGAEVEVIRNDAAPLSALVARRPDGVVVSPGPGTPSSGGVSVEAVRRFAERGVPVLGVCLGHQALAVAWGGRVRRAPTLAHGKTAPIRHCGRGVFAGLPSPFEATLYHSLVVDPDFCPSELEATAWGPHGEIMGLRHRSLPAEGVQFHPESILTREGPALIARFADSCRQGAAA